MKNNLLDFGKNLKNIRIKKGFTLRKTCKLVKYDPSNWSKIERGIIPPPFDEKILRKWAKVLEISDIQEFIDQAMIARGVISRDILSQKNITRYLPVFYRTLRGSKPTNKEITRLIKLIEKQI